MSEQRKTAIVTGASGGIGQAVAKAFVDRGYNVVLTGTNEDKLITAHAALGSPEAVLTLVADVGDAADRERLVDAALARFGRIDVLVNNAGLFEPRPFLEVDEAYLDRFLTVNLKGTFFLTQAVIPHLMAVGGGAIINVGTVLVDHATADWTHGIDVSHRGGKPGFAMVAHETLLLLPDYAGNCMFNTLGNIAISPKCGLLFIDFDTGDSLQLTGEAEILWEPAHTRRFPGAQRVLAFSVEETLHKCGRDAAHRTRPAIGLDIRRLFARPRHARSHGHRG